MNPRPDPEGAGRIIRDLCAVHQVEVIAIGDGTAGRETWHFILTLTLSKTIICSNGPGTGGISLFGL